MAGIRLEKFDTNNYADLIAWIDTEEMLMQFGGPSLTFPLTIVQLDISQSDKNRIAFSVVSEVSNTCIGHAEIYQSEDSVKLSRILIGDQAYRGKGLGFELVQLLLRYAFYGLNRMVVELYVFDWNTSAIRCYEKAGFSLNPSKKLERKMKDGTWTAINMVINISDFNDAIS